MSRSRGPLPHMGFLFVSLLALAATLTGGCVYVSTRGLLGRGVGPLEEKVLFGKGRDKVLVMEIQGLISEKERTRLFRLRTEPSMVAEVKEQLDKAARDHRVRGLLLMINSPGGTVTASDMIYNEIRRFKSDRKVRVVALLTGTATSGAYYVAQAADWIVAYPTGVTGSIGVILMNLNLNGLMEKIGVSDQSIKSGRYKDLGSPFRRPEEGEEEILQGVVDELHGRFVDLVQKNRARADLSGHPELVDGRIFTARQALDAGLVDDIGHVSDALEWLKRAVGVQQVRVIRYQRQGDYLPNIYALGPGENARVDINLIRLDVEGLLSACGPTFMYLWLPGW